MTALLLVAGPVATTAVGFALGWAWLFPFLGAAPAYPVFLRRVAARRYRSAFAWMLLWALSQSLAVGGATLLFPERAGQTIHRGRPYADEMIHWARTGEGPEGSPRLYLPLHARHFAGFCALTVLTAGSAGLVLGTWLLNYMNYYVAVLALQSVHTTTALLVGWPPWAVIRVIGFIAVAVGLTPVGLRLLRRRGGGAPAYLYLWGGVGLVVADAVLKWLLAPYWQGVVLGALTGSP